MENVVEKMRGIFRKEGVTGMESINHCILFVMSRKLNESNCEKYKIIFVDDSGISPAELLILFSKSVIL